MKTCATCKHRGDEPLEYGRYDDDYNDLPITYYECKKVAHGNKSSTNAYEPGQGALAVDGSGYHAALCVELTFGCVLHEDKCAAASGSGQEKA